MEKTRIFTITEQDASRRLDVYLAEKVESASRSALKNLLDEGKVLLDGKRTKAGHKLRAGQVVEVTLPEERPLEIAPEDIPIEILYEDDDIIIVNKPHDLSVHPGAGRASGTLVNALARHTKNLSDVDPMRPGIVHRLDKDTTGVLAVAKNNPSHHSLARQFRDHTTSRKYVALVWGVVRNNEGTIDLAIGRDAAHRTKISTKTRKARKAVSRYKVLRRYPLMTLVEITPQTGRTHQIRVHLSSSGHPIVGDPVYGRKTIAPNLPGPVREEIKNINRQLLHARMLGITHPKSGEYMEFSSDYPPDMKHLLDLLEKECTEQLEN